jgi:hypothetical protein
MCAGEQKLKKFIANSLKSLFKKMMAIEQRAMSAS